MRDAMVMDLFENGQREIVLPVRSRADKSDFVISPIRIHCFKSS